MNGLIETLFRGTLYMGASATVLLLVMLLISDKVFEKYIPNIRLRVLKALVICLLLPIGLFAGAVADAFPAASEVLTIRNYAAFDETGAAGQTVSGSELLSGAVSSVEAAAGMDIFKLLSMIWLIGAVLSALNFLLMYVRLVVSLRKNRTLPHAEEAAAMHNMIHRLASDRELNVYYNEDVSSPMIAGVVNPAVYLPFKKYTALELEFILKHETVHCLRHDLAYKALSVAALALNWYNPAAHLIVKFLNRDMELCCDYEVVEGESAEFKEAYSSMLMNEARSSNGPLVLACFGDTKEALKRRFKNIFTDKKAGNLRIAAVSALLLVFAIGISCIAYGANNAVGTEVFRDMTVKSITLTEIQSESQYWADTAYWNYTVIENPMLKEYDDFEGTGYYKLSCGMGQGDDETYSLSFYFRTASEGDQVLKCIDYVSFDTDYYHTRQEFSGTVFYNVEDGDKEWLYFYINGDIVTNNPRNGGVYAAKEIHRSSLIGGTMGSSVTGKISGQKYLAMQYRFELPEL